MLATERRLVGSVALRAMAADVARPAAIAGIDRHDRDARALGLVLHKRTQLEETPVAEPAAGPLANRVFEPSAKTGEVFDRDADPKCLCLLDEFLADLVVRFRLKSALSARHRLESTLGVLGPRSLILL